MQARGQALEHWNWIQCTWNGLNGLIGGASGGTYPWRCARQADPATTWCRKMLVGLLWSQTLLLPGNWTPRVQQRQDKGSKGTKAGEWMWRMSACGAAQACSGRQEAKEDLKSAAELGLWAQLLELKVTTETKTPNLLCSFSEPKHCFEIVIQCLFCHLANMVHFDLAAAKHMISWHV